MDQQLAQKILNETRQVYDDIAGKFSDTRSHNWPIAEKLAEQYIYPLLATHYPLRVLDVGCGNGRLYELLKDREVNYLGVDNSQKLVELAQRIHLAEAERRRAGGAFMLKDILDLGFNQEFNAVFSFAVLNHLPSRELRLQALKNMAAALKPGGLLLMTNWNLWKLSLKQKTVWKYKLSIQYAVYSIRYTVYPFKDVQTYFQDNAGRHALYYRAFTLRELKSLMREAGLEVLENYYEKRGQKAHWWNGDNLVSVCRKNKN